MLEIFHAVSGLDGTGNTTEVDSIVVDAVSIVYST